MDVSPKTTDFDCNKDCDLGVLTSEFSSVADSDELWDEFVSSSLSSGMRVVGSCLLRSIISNSSVSTKERSVLQVEGGLGWGEGLEVAPVHLVSPVALL